MSDSEPLGWLLPIGHVSCLPASMEIRLSFPGGRRVDAHFGPHDVRTDQSVEHGGEASAPEPFELFLTSLATCAGLYVLVFCERRGISMDGIEIVQRHRFDASKHRLEEVELELVLPPSFPEKYRDAVGRAAEGCKVRKTLASPPEVRVTTRVADEAGLVAAVGE